ncbi:TcpQ domain-containing protein [Vibrio fluvialis]|uniref:TcpQ domain-containing protein n=1 Tax=Vibrio fluvialis TaxID=676 RepID=UPI0023A95C49|nr:TcpQ domain-containing protein [Vibrio fluvialis]MDE5179018.1 TcpQ domain-containing protein [Vibrio fluvialis]
MKRNKLSAMLVALFALGVNTANAAVYINYDSLHPSYEQNLAQAQIESLKAMTKSQNRLADTNEFMVGEMVKYNREQQSLTDAKLENLMTQSVMLSQQRNAQLDEKLELTRQGTQLENQRIAMLREDQRREDEFRNLQAEQTKSALVEQEQQHQKFLAQQAKVQQATLDLQKRVNDTADMMLAKRLESNAPSNMIVASKDASNLKQVVKPTDVDQLGNLTETKTTSPLINMNEFVRSILPVDWKYFPSTGTDNQLINVVQGKDWQSILNHIAVNNPNLEFFIDPYKKELKVTNTIKTTPTDYKLTEGFRTWQVTTSKTLRGNLEEFARQASWTLLWDTNDQDYEIVASAVIRGTFAGEDGVVNQLMETTKKAKVPLYASWTPENRVVRIKRLGAKK